MSISLDEYKAQRQLKASGLEGSELHSLEAEEGFIYTFMHRPLDIFEALSKIDSVQYFYHSAARLCYTALKLALNELEDFNETFADSYEINPVALKPYLEAQGKLGSSEYQVSFDYLMRLYGSDDYNPADLKKYVKALANYAARRALFQSTEKTRQELAQPAQRIEDITASQLEAAYQVEVLADLDGRRSDFKAHSNDIIAIERMDFEAMALKKLEKPLPVTGIKAIDGDLDKGIFPFFDIGYDDLITVMGATGGGKSSFIHQIILESAKKGLNIFFANTENNQKNIRLRNLCYFTGIDFQRLSLYFAGYPSMLSKGELAHITAVDKSLRGEESSYLGRKFEPCRVDYYDASAKNADQLVSEAIKRHNLAQRSSLYGRKGYGLFVLDHIQDLERPGSLRHNDSDSDRHVYAMKRLKDLAYATNTPVLIASHITESLCEKTDEGIYKPTLYSSKGSREMALKAQLVLGLTLNKAHSACEIEVLKRNNGSVGDTQVVAFHPHRYHFG